MSLFTKAWFEEAKWPAEFDDEVTHQHLEDLRKRMFVMRNFGCGRDPEWPPENSNIAPEGGYSGTDVIEFYPGQLVVYWEGECWLYDGEIWRSQWYGVGAKDSFPIPPMEYHRPVRVTAGGTVYKTKLRHIPSAESEPGVGVDWATYWEVDTVPVDTQGPNEGNAWYTPPTWPLGTHTNGHYELNEWVAVKGNWKLTAENRPFIFVPSHRYHDYDESGLRVCRYKSKHGSALDPTYIDVTDFLQSETFPYQVAAPQVLLTVKFLDTGRMMWRYGDKIAFTKNIITGPKCGAGFTRVLIQTGNGSYWQVPSTDSYPEFLNRSQYSNGFNIHPSKFSTGGFNAIAGSNPKADDRSYQNQIEMQCDSTEFHAHYNSGSGSTYRANWETYYDKNFDTDLTETAFRHYPSLRDHLWGENGSAFENIKRINSEFDWYWDSMYTYEPSDYQIAREHSVLWNGSEWVHWSQVEPGHYPVPKGTWRRTWRRSLGRIPGRFYRSSEKGDPRTGSNNNFNGTSSNPGTAMYDGDGTWLNVKFYWPAGTFANTIPTIDQFVSWSFTKTDVDTYVFSVAGDKTEEFRVGAQIYIGSGTAIAGYGFADVRHSWHVEGDPENEEDEGTTFVKLLQPISGYTGDTVCGDIGLTDRHDPVEFDENGNPMFELTAALANEMRRTLISLHTSPANVSYQTKNITVFGGGQTWYFSGEDYFNVLSWSRDYVDNRLLSYPDPDDWNESESDPEFIVYEYDPYLVGKAEFPSGSPVVRSDGGYEVLVNKNTGEITYSTLGSMAGETSNYCKGFALKLSDPQNTFFGNIDSIVVAITHGTQEAVGPNSLYGEVSSPQKSHGLYAPVTEEYETRRSEVSASIDSQTEESAWIKFLPENRYPLVQSVYEENQDYEDSRKSGIAQIPNISILTEGVLFTIDYNKVPQSVMKRDNNDDRCFWGYKILEVDPINNFDDKAPLPNPSTWQIKPYANFNSVRGQLTTIPITGIASSVLSFDHTTYTLANGDKVEIVADTLPAGTLKDTIYVVSDISDGTFKLTQIVDSEIIPITITSAGTNVSISKCNYTELQIAAYITQGRDVDNQSLPLRRRMVGYSGAWTTDFALSPVFIIVQRILHDIEFFYCGGVSLVTGINAESTGALLTIYANVSTEWVDDAGGLLYVIGIDGLDPRQELTIKSTADVPGETYKEIVLYCPHIPPDTYSQTAAMRIRRPALDGYGEDEWALEDCVDYEWRPQTKDNAGTLGNGPVDNLTSLPGAEQCKLLQPIRWAADELAATP